MHRHKYIVTFSIDLWQILLRIIYFDLNVSNPELLDLLPTNDWLRYCYCRNRYEEIHTTICISTVYILTIYIATVYIYINNSHYNNMYIKNLYIENIFQEYLDQQFIINNIYKLMIL